MRNSLLTSLLATAAGVGMTASWAGQVVGPVRLQDQFGHAHTLAAGTRRIYFTHDMDGGKLLNAALDATGKLVAGWPRAPGKVTVMELDDFSITGAAFAGDEPTLEAFVQPR